MDIINDATQNIKNRFACPDIAITKSIYIYELFISIFNVFYGLGVFAYLESSLTWSLRLPGVFAYLESSLTCIGSSYASYGSIEIDKLYESPFTGIDSDDVDGVFPNDKDVDDLIDIIEIFAASAKNL